MNLSQLTSITQTKKRRLGQGHGSGRVKTSGRGTKGQKARNHVKLAFEGGALPLIKRLPFRRGKGRNETLQLKPVTVSLEKLNHLPKNATVDLEFLIKHKLVNENEVKHAGVKILGNGKLEHAYTVSVLVSAQARVQIEQAGGSVNPRS